MTIFWTSFFSAKKGPRKRNTQLTTKSSCFRKTVWEKKHTKNEEAGEQQGNKNAKTMWFQCVSFLFFLGEKKKHKEKNRHLYHHPPAIIKGAGGPHSSFAASDKALEAVSLVPRNCHRFTPLKFNARNLKRSRPWKIRRFRNLESQIWLQVNHVKNVGGSIKKYCTADGSELRREKQLRLVGRNYPIILQCFKDIPGSFLAGFMNHPRVLQKVLKVGGSESQMGKRCLRSPLFLSVSCPFST